MTSTWSTCLGVEGNALFRAAISRPRRLHLCLPAPVCPQAGREAAPWAGSPPACAQKSQVSNGCLRPFERLTNRFKRSGVAIVRKRISTELLPGRCCTQQAGMCTLKCSQAQADAGVTVISDSRPYNHSRFSDSRSCNHSRS